MKTSIVYSLICDYSDYYLEQLMMSLYSLRKTNPTAKVTLITDKSTNNLLSKNQYNLNKYVNTILTVETPDSFSKSQRSRYIKTNIRNYIKGDYLFIDTDTIICSSLEEIDNFNHEICAVLDNHGDAYNDFTKNWITNKAKIMDWIDVLAYPHFNSGVFFVKDTPLTHRFYQRWFELWSLCNNKQIYIDQLSLRKVNSEFNQIIHEIEGIWNCQVRYPKGELFKDRAKIIHYQASDPRIYYSICAESVFLKIKIGGILQNDILSLLNNPQESFSKKQMIISGEQIKFIQSHLYDVFLNHYSFYNILVHISLLYSKLFTSVYCIKQKIYFSFFNKSSK